jgi:hypothetical protein
MRSVLFGTKDGGDTMGGNAPAAFTRRVTAARLTSANATVSRSG